MKIIGIDLGTSNTYIYASNSPDAQPEAVILPKISDDSGSIATVVMYEDSKPYLAGNLAESEFYSNLSARPRRKLVSQFKPEIARNNPVAIQSMIDFLRLLRIALPKNLIEADTKIYVGFPSLSREDFSLNLSSCFIAAGWPKPYFVRESDAALVSCLQSGVLSIEDMDKKCLILDFGGGTCDFTSIESMDALQNGGDILYGGRLFDDLFFQIFCKNDSFFAREAPLSPYAWYVHWIECRKQKELFSDFLSPSNLAKDGPKGYSLHAVWYDVKGERHDSFVADYTKDSFIRDAENFKASTQLLEILSEYRDRGGLSDQARDLLEGRQVGLVSWLRFLLEKVTQRRVVGKVVLTGGSSRWFFVAETAHSVFPIAECVNSKRGYEDIAFGLALFPQLTAAYETVRNLLDKKIASFTTKACEKARSIIQRQTQGIVRMCAERIVSRDVMPALEAAHGNSMTVGELEQLFAENIKNDPMLLEIAKEKSSLMAQEIQDELNFSFRAWLRENGVMLVPFFTFPYQAIGNDFFNNVSVSISRLDSLNLMKFTLTKILPILAATATAGAIAHTAEPVSTIVGGSLALGATWFIAKTAPGFLQKRKLPAFFLNERNRKKIVEKNKVYIEKALKQSLEDAQDKMSAEIEQKIKSSLVAMLNRLTVLNQVKTE